MSNKLSVRDLTEGAMLAALSVMLFFASHALPFIGTFLLMIVGVPLTLLVIRRGMPAAAIASAAATLAVSFLFGLPMGVTFVVLYLPLSLAVGWMFAHRRGAGKTIVAAVVASSVSVALLLLLGVAITGFSMEALAERMNAVADMMIATYRDAGLLEQMAAQGMTEDVLRQSIHAGMALLPAMMVIMGGILGLVHFVVSRFTMRKLRMKIPRMPKFSQWYLPSWSIWGLIVAWSGWLLADYLQLGYLTTFAINIMVIYGALLFFTGLSVLAHFMKFQQMTTGFKVLIIFFGMIFISGVFLLSVLAGLFDLIFDFRKLRKANAAEDAQ